MVLSTPFKYSYKWAQEVVEAFTERYARGTYFLCWMAGMKPEKLALYLISAVRRDNQVLWEAMKRLIKDCTRERREDYASLSLAERRKCLTYMKYTAENFALWLMETKARPLAKPLDLPLQSKRTGP